MKGQLWRLKCMPFKASFRKGEIKNVIDRRSKDETSCPETICLHSPSALMPTNYKGFLVNHISICQMPTLLKKDHRKEESKAGICSIDWKWGWVGKIFICKDFISSESRVKTCGLYFLIRPVIQKSQLFI